jgi:hypothetical protein
MSATRSKERTKATRGGARRDESDRPFFYPAAGEIEERKQELLPHAAERGGRKGRRAA